jgi:hypothetical protein
LTSVVRRSSCANESDFVTTYGRVSAFVSECNAEHVRYAPEQFADLCRALSWELVRAGQESLKFAFIDL